MCGQSVSEAETLAYFVYLVLCVEMAELSVKMFSSYYISWLFIDVGSALYRFMWCFKSEWFRKPFIIHHYFVPYLTKFLNLLLVVILTLMLFV